MSAYAVSVDEAMSRLEVLPDYDPGGGPQPCVHTFMSAAFGLLGAHWPLDKVRDAMEAHGVEESGSEAQALNHGLVVILDKKGRKVPLFLETQADGGEG